MSRQSAWGGNICDEIKLFHNLQDKKRNEEALNCLRRICDIKGFIIDKSKYCDMYGKVVEKPLEVDESAKREALLRVSLSDRTVAVDIFMVIPLDINVNSFKEMIHKYYGFPPSEQIFILQKERRPDDFTLNHKNLTEGKNKDGFYDVEIYLKDALLRKRKQEGQQFNTEQVIRGMVPKDAQQKREARRQKDKSEIRRQSNARHRSGSQHDTPPRSSQRSDSQLQEQQIRQQHPRTSTHQSDAAIAQQLQQEEWEAQNVQREAPQQKFQDVSPVQSAGKGDSTWTCPLCTFVNDAWRPGCEQCSTDKP